MGLPDIIDVLANLSLIGDSKPKPRRPKIYLLFIILYTPGIFWFLIELSWIFILTSPILFIVVFTLVGLLLSIVTIAGIYRLRLIEQMRPKDFFTILIPTTLLTISLASFINRTYGIIFQG